jgi:hypothetical protein
MRLCRFFLWFIFATGLATAAPLTRDLGRNLVFYRVHALPADLPSDAARKQPCVIDLRYLQAETDDAAALHAWIKFHATPRTPVFVLANAKTTRALLAPFAHDRALGNVLVIGAPAPNFEPDIAVQTSAENERAAYDALDNGADLAALLTENADKARNDEASLSHDRSSEPAAANADAAKARSAPPPIDAALQRAVHLHRTLVALKKI